MKECRQTALRLWPQSSAVANCVEIRFADVSETLRIIESVEIAVPRARLVAPDGPEVTKRPGPNEPSSRRVRVPFR